MQCVCTSSSELPKCIVQLMIKKNHQRTNRKYWHFIYKILTLKFNEEQIYV